MAKKIKTKHEVIRIHGRLKEITTVIDASGRVLHKIISPLMVEFYSRDVLQVLVGASILAIPVGYTEEAWNLGATLPLYNIIGFLLLSLLFISSFVYYNYYRERLKQHFSEFIKRTLSTYIISFIVVAILLTLIQKTPWTTDWLLAFKRVVIVTFPASLSAAIADVIK
ncbi:MAG: DUF2391 family protein [Nanoarchaeota archaeon]